VKNTACRYGLKIVDEYNIKPVNSKNIWNAGAPPPWDEGVADPLETRFSTTCVTVLNFVILGQSIRPFCYKKNKMTRGRVKIKSTYVLSLVALSMSLHKNGIP